MTVKATQRTADEETLERHDHIYNEVERVKVYKSVLGDMFLHMIFRDGRGLHINLCFFDIEVEE